jgi:hypothetical protein
MDPRRQSFEAAQLRRSAAAMREWSVALRAWSRLARARSRAIRPPDGPLPRSGATEGGDGIGDEVSMGVISVSELFTILVDNHHFDTHEAAEALILQLERVGYPTDAAVVSAVDGFDIVQAALDARA